LQLHDKLTFPHINSLTLRHRVVSWRASIRHSCETTISGYTTCLFGAKSCETRYRAARSLEVTPTALPSGMASVILFPLTNRTFPGRPHRSASFLLSEHI